MWLTVLRLLTNICNEYQSKQFASFIYTVYLKKKKKLKYLLIYTSISEQLGDQNYQVQEMLLLI